MKRRVQLRKESESDTATIKKEIQRLAREIVIRRDGGCVLRNVRDIAYIGDMPFCNGYANDGHLVLQADHLITRGNSASYADTRLIVCVCKGHHGWKSVGSNLRKKQYDAIVRQIISPARVALWDKMEASSWKPTKVNWALELAALKQELATMSV